LAVGTSPRSASRIKRSRFLAAARPKGPGYAFEALPPSPSWLPTSPICPQSFIEKLSYVGQDGGQVGPKIYGDNKRLGIKADRAGKVNNS
jgi:hypothetical protein